MNEIAAACADFRFECVERETALTRLARFSALLLERNAAVNLTAARNAAAVADHVRDSLSIATYVREPFADVGSGGGFPAIPLAIATGLRGVMIEAVGKKAAFLRDIVAELGLPLEVVQARAEEVGRRPEMRASFAAATARAVAGISTVLELTVPLLRIGGLAVLQRGPLADTERAAANDAALILGAELVAEAAIASATGRCVLVFEKRVITGARWPRRNGVPAKRPLCGPAVAHSDVL